MDFQDSVSVNFWAGLWNKHGDQSITAATRVIVIVVAYFLIRLALFKLISRLAGSLLSKTDDTSHQGRKARVRAVRSILKSAVGFGLGLVAAIMVAEAMGFNIIPLITSVSVAGLAIRFGAQRLVRDVIAGIFILIEDQYGVGDYVTVGALSGIVEDLGVRITKIRERNGKLCIIANGDIAQVCNHSRGKLVASLDVAVPTNGDLEKSMRVLNEVGVALAGEMPGRIIEPYKCEGLAQVSAASTTIRLQGIIAPAYQDEVLMAMNARIRQAFDKDGLGFA